MLHKVTIINYIGFEDNLSLIQCRKTLQEIITRIPYRQAEKSVYWANLMNVFSDMKIIDQYFKERNFSNIEKFNSSELYFIDLQNEMTRNGHSLEKIRKLIEEKNSLINELKYLSQADTDTTVKHSQMTVAVPIVQEAVGPFDALLSSLSTAPVPSTQQPKPACTVIIQKNDALQQHIEKLLGHTATIIRIEDSKLFELRKSEVTLYPPGEFGIVLVSKKLDSQIKSILKNNKKYWFFVLYKDSRLSLKDVRKYSEQYNTVKLPIDLYQSIYDDDYLDEWISSVFEHFTQNLDSKNHLKTLNQEIDRQYHQTVNAVRKDIIKKNEIEKKNVEERLLKIDGEFRDHQHKQKLDQKIQHEKMIQLSSELEALKTEEQIIMKKQEELQKMTEVKKEEAKLPELYSSLNIDEDRVKCIQTYRKALGDLEVLLKSFPEKINLLNDILYEGYSLINSKEYHKYQKFVMSLPHV